MDTGGRDLERSKYTDAFKISVLAEYDLDGQMKATAKRNGVPYKTMRNWVDQRREQGLESFGPESQAQMDLVKKEMVRRSADIMSKALQVIESKLDDCSAPQAATVYGILHDKMTTMEGQITGTGSGTTNIIINQIPDEEASRLMAKALDRLDRMKGRSLQTSYEIEED